MAAFYDDGTGLCHWCPKKAVEELYGLPLCDEHYEEQIMADNAALGTFG